MKRLWILWVALLLCICALPVTAERIQAGQYFDDCRVVTTMQVDGTFTRTITLTNSIDNDRAMRELYGDIEARLAPLAPEGVAFRALTEPLVEEGMVSEYGNVRVYIFNIAATDTAGLNAATNAILQATNNSYVVSFSASADMPGRAALSVNETWDVSAYIAPGNAIYSEFWTQTLVWDEWSESAIPRDQYNFGNNLYYNALSFKSYTRETMTAYAIPFEQAAVTVGAADLETAQVTLAFWPAAKLPAQLKHIQRKGLEQTAKGLAVYGEENDCCTLTFSGDPETVTKDLRDFVGEYASAATELPGWNSIPNSWYRTLNIPVDTALRLSPMSVASKFEKGLWGELTLDLSPVVGQGHVTVATDGVEQIGIAIVGGQVCLEFYTTYPDSTAFIVAAVSGVLLLAGLALLIWKFRAICRLFVKKPAPTPPPAPPEPETAEPEEEPITFVIPEIYIASGEEDESP